MDTTIPVIILTSLIVLAALSLSFSIIAVIKKQTDKAVTYLTTGAVLFIVAYTFVSVLAVLQEHGKI